MMCGDNQDFENIHLCDLVGVGGNFWCNLSHTTGCMIYLF
jgi:hypothetical protein